MPRLPVAARRHARARHADGRARASTVKHVQPGDVYLLCSDGLSEPLAEARIAALLELPAEAACRALVDAAYEAGSRDNISAIVVRVLR